MREFQTLCEDNPDLVFDQTPFKVIIQNNWRSWEFEHLKPVPADMLIDRTYPDGTPRKKDEFTTSVDDIVQWISGGPDGMRSKETDIYGVVQFEAGAEIAQNVLDLYSRIESGKISEDKAVQEIKAFHKGNKKKNEEALQGAREIADNKVRRALKMTHNNLHRQWEILNQEGKGKYAPSIAELVGAHILKAELDKASQRRTKAMEGFMENMKSVII